MSCGQIRQPMEKRHEHDGAPALPNRCILDRLEIELAGHAGTGNGKLPVTFDDFCTTDRNPSFDHTEYPRSRRTGPCGNYRGRTPAMRNGGSRTSSGSPIATPTTPSRRTKSKHIRSTVDKSARHGRDGGILSTAGGNSGDARQLYRQQSAHACAADGGNQTQPHT